MLVKGYFLDFTPFLDGYFFFIGFFVDSALFSLEGVNISLSRGYPSLYVSGKLLITTYGDDAP